MSDHLDSDPPRSRGGPLLSRRRLLHAGAATTVAASAAVIGPPTAARASVPGAVPAAARTLLPKASTVYAAASDPADLGVLEAASLLQSGMLSSVELTRACQDRIEQRNGAVSFGGSSDSINAWIRLYPDLAGSLSQAADTRLAASRQKGGTPTPLLCGIPLGLKDLYAVQGMPVTASSHVLDGNVAAGDSTAWARLKAAGMVLLGHTHTHEFAYGWSTPQCGNPWDLSKSAGGSSGGSAAAIAAGMVPAALGSDTAGSLRSPSSATGVTVLKPTFGLVSTHGVIPVAWSMDHAGPMARSAGDLGLMLATLAGPDQEDTASLASGVLPNSYPTMPRPGARPLTGIRIGVGADEASTLPASLGALFARAISQLADLGATIVGYTEPVAGPSILTGTPGYTVEVEATYAIENGGYHQQFYPAKAAGYGPALGAQIAAQISAANGISAPLYVSYQRTRIIYVQEWNLVFNGNRLDAILKPGANVDGFDRAGAGAVAPGSGVNGDYPWADYSGLPVCGFTVGQSAVTGMPFGVQLGGAPHSETKILQIAVDYQAAYPYHEDRPAAAA